MRSGFTSKASRENIRRQFELLNLSRNNLYYKPKPLNANEPLILNKFDEIYTGHPYYGSRRMQEELLELEVAVCRQKIHRDLY